ncbi:MAG TPA: RHS repeat-associated core domain-containing protein, partial [Flavobacterium sp.]|nr:RHS repeat-associated core domain-containing protein [Flavobacterium sp.]
YKFNGKELDEATQMYYYGARYYDPRISIFVSVDPLAEKTMQPYIYCANNPILFVDPDGRHIIIYYKNAQGKEVPYIYGSKMRMPSNKYVRNTVKMIDKLTMTGSFDNITILGKKMDKNMLKQMIDDKNRHLSVLEIYNKGNQNSSAYIPQDYIPGTYNPKEGKYGSFAGNSSYGTLRINDEYGIEFDINGKTYTNSPTSQTAHEIIHAIHKELDINSYNERRDSKTYIPGLGNMEEQITTQETNQINERLGEPSRQDYTGTMIKMDDPTVNKKSEK